MPKDEPITLDIEVLADKMQLGDLAILDLTRRGHFVEFFELADRALIINGKPGARHLPFDPMLVDRIGGEVLRQVAGGHQGESDGG